MKKNSLIVIAILLSSLFFLDCFMFPEIKVPDKAAAENPGFAVVELFTSEGCSSCPPADELMKELQLESKDKNIYLLVYHVDYWDRLGWKDRFSAQQFTSRQQDYQNWLQLPIMYTPQFIINGTTEFAGYSKATLYNKVSDALATKQSVNLSLTAHTDKNAIAVHYKTSWLQKNVSLFIATVQKNGTSKVERGENSGSTLHHVQIVTAIKTIVLDKTEGNLVIEKPAHLNAKDLEIIGFLQNELTGKIISTAKISFQ